MWNLQETASRSNEEVEDEEGWSLFYSNSTNMAAQVISFPLQSHTGSTRKYIDIICLKSSDFYIEIFITVGVVSKDLPFYHCLHSLFQVDDNKTVGLEAFVRIAPACTVIADVITVHNLFDVLTLSSGHKLHFLIYDKYLRSLEK